MSDYSEGYEAGYKDGRVVGYQDGMRLAREVNGNMAAELESMHEENAKLRELAQEMWLFTSLTHEIVGEIHSREHGTWNADTFRERMCELGIEV